MMGWAWETQSYDVNSISLKHDGLTRAIVSRLFGQYSVYSQKANKIIGVFDSLNEAKAWAQAVCRMEVAM